EPIMTAQASGHPRLAPRARLHTDRLTGEPMLLFPESMLRLNPTAAATLGLCSGALSLKEIISALARRYRRPAEAIAAGVGERFQELTGRHLMLEEGPSAPTWGAGEMTAESGTNVDPGVGPPRPLGLLAELTYRCPLHCPYCSNPLNLQDVQNGLSP